MGAKHTMKTFFAAMNEQVAPTRGYGPRIVATPMGPFSWNDNLGVWVNINNGMKLNNLAFQDMYAMMDYNSLSGDNSITDYGVYGSKLASQFLYDAISGTDSVDFVTIGDSNAGFALPDGNAGYQVGFDYAFALQTTVYATPLFYTNFTGAATELNSTNKPIPAGICLGISGNNKNPGGGTYDLLSRSTDADITVLKNTIGFTAPSELELKPIGDTYDSVVVNSGKTYTSAANSNFI